VLIVTLCLVGAFAWAGPQKEKTTTAPAAPAKRVVGGLQLPLSETPASLRIASGDNWYTPKSYTTGLPVWAEIQKQTNVALNWEVTPMAQWNDVVVTLFAAGQDMPDMIDGSYNVNQYFGAGLVLDLKPLIDKYAPNIKRQLADRQLVTALITTPAGNIPRLPYVYVEKDMGQTWLVRQDWLDKVGLKIPKTIDEAETVLRAFRDKDPNGNGKKDEIPMGFTDVWGPFYVIPHSFGVHAANDFYPDANGKIQYVPTLPGYRDYVAWMAKMYAEKTLDQDFITGNYEQYMAKLANNLIGLTVGFMGNADNWNTSNPGAKWVAFLPPDGPGGKKAFSENRPAIGGNFVITKDAKDPVLAIKWMDYVWGSEEGVRYANWGIQGTSYTMVGGKPQFTDFVNKNPDGLSRNDALRSLGAMFSVAFIVDPNAITLSGVTPEMQKLNAANIAIMTTAYPHYDMPHTPDEDAVFQKYFNDINTFQNEHLFNFIAGKEPISGFDAYVQKMYDIGLDKVLATEQVIYDRFKSFAK
jgi:putative aldouronate transport system substrate-binding protein